MNAATGPTSPFFDQAKMAAALATVAGVSEADAQSLARRASSTWNPSRSAILLSIGDDLYHYETGAARVTRLTSDRGEERDAAYSPDGRLVAFTRDNDLYVVEVGSGRERQLTLDGSTSLPIGMSDALGVDDHHTAERLSIKFVV